LAFIWRCVFQWYLVTFILFHKVVDNLFVLTVLIPVVLFLFFPFAAVIGGFVVGILAAILLVMFIVYRMRKKDEGSYALDEQKQPPIYPYAYQKAPTKEFYA
uniref:Syndecan n=1 Tax=Enterobius vermicularis TaxID=51028 RepID=A0A0N4VR05_ENTVE